MSVVELISLLKKVNTETATVYMDDSNDIERLVRNVVVEHDLREDEVVVVLKPNKSKD